MIAQHLLRMAERESVSEKIVERERERLGRSKEEREIEERVDFVREGGALAYAWESMGLNCKFGVYF